MEQSAQRKRKRPQVTGLRLDRELVKKMKYRALDENSTLTKTVEKALEAYLRTKA
jgi:hypothetical protein